MVEPERGELWDCLGYAFLQMDLHSDAIDALHNAIRLGFCDTSTQSNLIVALIEAGRVEEGVERALEWTTAESENYRAWQELSRALTVMARHDDAINAIRRAVALSGRELSPRLELGDLLICTGRPEEAYSTYEQVAQDYPTNIDVLRGLGYSASLCSDWSTACKAFEQISAAGSADAADHAHLGNCYLSMSNWSKASNHFRSAIALGAQAIEVFAGLGLTEAMLGRHSYAADSYREVLKLDPNFLSRYPEHTEIVRRVGVVDDVDKH